ncbi:MAG: STAS domain-containing protein [Planctomycetota bacterium]|nr:STAS domain-containing protein [Planctomycetota bacterium]
MAQPQKNLSVSTHDGIVKAEICVRDLIDEIQIRAIGQELEQVIVRNASPKLVIGFDAVSHLSSAALGMLIKVDNAARAKGGAIRLACINQSIMTVFKITKLDKHLHLDATIAEAIDALKK